MLSTTPTWASPRALAKEFEEIRRAHDSPVQGLEAAAEEDKSDLRRGLRLAGA